MPEPEFEMYLSLMSKLLRLNASQKADISEELRVHLEDRLAELEAQGTPRSEAIRLALDEFGDAGALAFQFTRPHSQRRRRQIMRYSIGTFCALAGIFTLVNLNWPAGPDGPPTVRTVVAQIDPTPEEEEPAEQPSADAKPPEASQDELRQQIEARLTRRDYEFNFVDMPLAEVLAFLSDQIQIDIIADLRDFGGGGNITLRARQGALSVKSALELMLRQAGGTALTYSIKDGVILISNSNEEFEVQVYDCRDLLAGMQPPGGQAVGMGSGGGFFSVPAEMTASALGQLGGANIPAAMPGPETISTSPAGGALIAVIQAATRPAVWHDARMGEAQLGGSISEYDGMIVVRHNQAVHRKIDDVLKKLRQARLGMAANQEPHRDAEPVVIPKGKRLVTLSANGWELPVNAVQPGRRVDVVQFREIDGEMTHEVILSNAEIVLPQGMPFAPAGFTQPTMLRVNTVSLIVSPEEAVSLHQTELVTPHPLKFVLRGEDEDREDAAAEEGDEPEAMVAGDDDDRGEAAETDDEARPDAESEETGDEDRGEADRDGEDDDAAPEAEEMSDDDAREGERDDEDANDPSEENATEEEDAAAEE